MSAANCSAAFGYATENLKQPTFEMKLPDSKQTKIYNAIHEEVMKVRIAIRMGKMVSADSLDEMLSKIPDRALDEILKA